MRYLVALFLVTACQWIGAPATTCTDGKANALETDVDCGGSVCLACTSGKLCLMGSDCASTLCALNRCVERSCLDGLRNGDETDIDCGGSCAPCEPAQRCLVSNDCRLKLCTNELCAEASCTDGARNSTESDVDCGGSCAGCALGRVCTRSADCSSGLCVDGQCASAPVASCGAGLLECGGGCVNAQFDLTNCGSCGRLCAPGETCNAGSCALACLGGSVDCGGQCVDTSSNPVHCGGCGQPCGPGQVCVNSTCQSVCDPGATLCGGECVQLSRDALHCGSCPNVCGPGRSCVAGQCTIGCPAPLSACNNTTCVDTRSDPNNCGQCGFMCPWPPGALPSCINGQCGMSNCVPSNADCNGQAADGCEVDLAFDANCGACGHVCSGQYGCTIFGCCLPTLPSGSYTSTCTNCLACEGTLSCTCADQTMTPQQTSISLTPACGGGYVNCNGALFCNNCP